MLNHTITFTGHPLIDVGVATMTAFAGKDDPQKLEIADMEAIARFMRENYARLKPLQNYLSVIFHNAHFSQKKTVTDKLAYADEVLFAFRQDELAKDDDERCAFFPHLKKVMTAYRQHIPLLNGMNIGNFSAMGEPGLPVSGLAMLAIHAMPLGVYKCGHLLLFHQLGVERSHSGGAMVMVTLAKQALKGNRDAISMMREDSAEGSLPNYGSFYRTRYVDFILKATPKLKLRGVNMNNITGYYFTNYGPSPSIQIVRLNNDIFAFLSVAQLHKDWERVVNRAWQRPKEEKDAVPTDAMTTTWRNTIYEMLFQLPYNARKFLHQLGYSWTLIEIFLRKVMRMDQERINTYRELGDRLARYAMDYENQPVSFYYNFTRARSYLKLRNLLKSASERTLKANASSPLLSYSDFIMAFENPSETYSQWRLGRDLIGIRMLEVLHENQITLDDLPESDFVEAEENDEE